MEPGDQGPREKECRPVPVFFGYAGEDAPILSYPGNRDGPGH